MEAYIASEGMARFCTEDYSEPENAKHGEEHMDDADLFSHLTNYCLNRENAHYVNNDDFKNNDNGSKRLLSSVYKSLEHMGVDTNCIKQQIKDICTKIVLAFQPFLIHSFHNEMGSGKDCNQRWFHIFGLDVLLDADLKCWVMEINCFPSFSYFFEHTVYDDEDIPTRTRTVSELDKYLKTLILKQAIMMMKGDVRGRREINTFEQVFPPQENSEAYKHLTLYNDTRLVFELLAGFKKADYLTLSQFQKLWSYPGMRSTTLDKPEYGIIYQNYKKKGTKNSMTLEGFNSALEHIGKELFPELSSEYKRFALIVKRIIDYAME